jgi:hypothetical protein
VVQMGPPKMTAKAGRTISNEAFNDLVKENMDDLGMDPTKALQDAIQTLTLQGVDLSALISQNPHFHGTLHLTDPAEEASTKMMER